MGRGVRFVTDRLLDIGCNCADAVTTRTEHPAPCLWGGNEGGVFRRGRGVRFVTDLSRQLAVN